MLGCADPEGGAPNLITVAWTGVVCSKPPMLSVRDVYKRQAPSRTGLRFGLGGFFLGSGLALGVLLALTAFEHGVGQRCV